MNEVPTAHLRIWQQNLNKSLNSQLHLLHSAHPHDWDIILIQEPWMSPVTTRSSHHWNVLYPNAFRNDGSNSPRSLIFVNTNISSDTYTQLKFTSTDVSGLQIKMHNQTYVIINIYNDCNQNDSIDAVSEFLDANFPDEHVPDNTHVILGGDFNRHHAWWEEARNSHLTSSETLLQPLMDLITRFDLRMALPPILPTLEALASGNWTRPDNVWCSSHSSDLFIRCTTDPGLRGPNTDHVPILSILDVPIPRIPKRQTRNFRNTDWAEFNSHLSLLLAHSPKPSIICTRKQFHPTLDLVSNSIKAMIEAIVPIANPIPSAKRWWNADLNALRKKKNRLAKLSHKWRGLPDHHAHADHRATSKEYSKLIDSTKKAHWDNWLSNAAERDLWTANKYATDPPTDSGRSRIPALIFKEPDGTTRCRTRKYVTIRNLLH